MEGNRREPQAAAVDQGGGEYTFPPRSPAALSSGHLLHRHDSGSVRVYVQGAASPLSGGRHGVGELQRLGQQSVFGAEAPQGRRHPLLANRCGSSTPESLLSEIPAKAGDLEATTISRAPRRLLLQHRPSGRLLRHGVGAGGPSIHDLRDPATVGRFLRFQEHPGPTLRLAYGLDPFPLLLRENDGTCVSLSTLANVFGSKLPSALPAARSTPAPAGLPAAPLYGRHSVPLQLPGRSLGVEGAGCGSIGASRIVSQPEEGPVGPWTADTSPGAGHRFSALRVSGPEGQTRKDIVTGPRPIVPRCSQQALGACEGVGSAGRPGTISVLGNPCCPVLSSRATRRHGDSLRALAARQEDTIVSAHRAPLPASVALKIYNLAVQLIHSSKLCNMSLLRACCATIFSYFFFNRSGTTRGILNKDVASSGTDLLFYERQTKGKAGLDDAARTLYTAGHPQMAALMDHFTAIKSAYCASQQVALPLCYFALPGEDPASWTSNTQTEWLSMAYTAVGCSPPAGFAWTSHSLRSGAACAAQAEGWSDSDLCKYGGWVVGSAALQEAYLKVPVRPCTGSLFFFGWLKTRLHSGQPLPL